MKKGGERQPGPPRIGPDFGPSRPEAVRLEYTPANCYNSDYLRAILRTNYSCYAGRDIIVDAQAFWNVIGNYNQSTMLWQCVVLALIITSLILAYFQKAMWLPKITLGIGNIFIGIMFFLIYGTEPIQTYFAAPLYLIIGCLFIYEASKYRTDRFNKPGAAQWVLLCLIIVYPLVSFLLGHSFPQLVVYIMPCPIISLSIVTYSCYDHKNKLLLLLMTIWGLTGIKAFFADALEDIILLICGLFCLWLLIKELKIRQNV